MSSTALVSTDTYACKTCDVEFSLPSTETPVCCPVCRMNRLQRLEAA